MENGGIEHVYSDQSEPVPGLRVPRPIAPHQALHSASFLLSLIPIAYSTYPRANTLLTFPSSLVG